MLLERSGAAVSARSNVIVEYWLAGWFGQAWLGLRRGLRSRLAQMPGRCRDVARGESLAADQLWRVQDFAVRVWWRFGMAAVLLILPVGGVVALLQPGRVGTDVGTSLVFGLGCVMAVAGAQMALLRYRADRTRRHVLRGGPKAAGQPLPPGAAGLPRRSDFWVMLVISLAFCAVLISAAIHSTQH
jgi:hypothetical protein